MNIAAPNHKNRYLKSEFYIDFIMYHHAFFLNFDHFCLITLNVSGSYIVFFRFSLSCFLTLNETFYRLINKSLNGRFQILVYNTKCLATIRFPIKADHQGPKSLIQSVYTNAKKRSNDTIVEAMSKRSVD